MKNNVGQRVSTLDAKCGAGRQGVTGGACSSFDYYDPEVRRLAGASSSAGKFDFFLIAVDILEN